VRAFAVLILSVFLLACSAPAGKSRFASVGPKQVEEGLGGTGAKYDAPEDGGIGGTGLIADIDDGEESGGLGGTGISQVGIGGTGIVGTITKFGSIWVNNAHIHFDANTPVTIDYHAASQNDLRLGQVVAVLSDREEDDYQARSIDVVHEVIGAIDELAPAAENQSHIYVLNQLIHVSDKTRLFNQISNKDIELADLISLVGEMAESSSRVAVKVSGLRQRSGVVKASRLDVISSESLPRSQLIGELSVGRQGQYSISGQLLEIPPWLVPESLPARVFVRGGVVDGRLIVDDIGQDSTRKVLSMASKILMEGFVFSSDIDDIISIGGFDIDLPDGVDVEMPEQFDMEDMPVQVFGSIMDDDFRAEDVVFFSEELDDFVDVLPEDVLDISEHADFDVEYDAEYDGVDEIEEWEAPEYEGDEVFEQEFYEFEE